MNDPKPIRIVTITGSVRPGNNTNKALAIVQRELASREDISVDEVNPAAMTLSLPGLASTPDAVQLRERVQAATGVIFATPEYHGSFSSITKLVIENLGFPSVLAGKPVALLGVAAGQIGAIKSLESLASICLHVGAIVLPGPVSIANVLSVFDAEGNCLDATVEKRLSGLAAGMAEYIHGNICPRHTLEAMVRERAA